MLRVTHNSQLSLHPKETRFNRDFWRGLLLACAIHATLILSIRLTLPPNLDAIKPMAPIEVETDLGLSVTAQVSVAQVEYLPRQNSPFPSHDRLLELFCLQISQNSFPLTKFSENDFSHIEVIEYEPLANLIEEEVLH